jgi:alpha-N-arabinofuranosidase
MFLDGNVYLNGAQPSKHEPNPLVLPDMDPGIELVEKADGLYLHVNHDKAWLQQERSLVTTEMLGKAKTPDIPYLNYNGQTLRIDIDYFGNRRNTSNPYPGPLIEPKEGRQAIKVWPKK